MMLLLVVVVVIRMVIVEMMIAGASSVVIIVSPIFFLTVSRCHCCRLFPWPVSGLCSVELEGHKLHGVESTLVAFGPRVSNLHVQQTVP